VGTEEYGGVPTPTRRGDPRPPTWRLEAIAATERPRSIAVAPAGDVLALIVDRDTSDVWLLDPAGRELSRLTTGRAPMPYWEDAAPAVSPDGSQVAYGDEGWICLVPVAGGPPRRLVEADTPVWLRNDRLVVSLERDERSQLAVAGVDDPWLQPLVRSAPGLDRAGDEWHAAVSPDGRHVAFAFTPRADLHRTEIRVVDVETGEVRALTGAPAVHDQDPVWSPDGTRLAFVAQRGEWFDLRTVDPATGEERLLAAADADFSAPAWSPDGSRLAAIRTAGFTYDLVVVDAATGAEVAALPGGAWGTPQWTRDGAIVATYEDQATPPELRLVRGGDQETLLAPAPLPVRRAPHVRPQEVSFPSLDGVEVQALLFRPAPGPRPAPAVVYVHGGPFEHYGDEWDGHAQYFVEKGYGWLGLNYRGSTGRGRGFQHLGDLEGGHGQTSDCLAAADYLRTLDWVDGSKLGVFGPSWGSYLALCAVTDDPDHRFRCAVCKYGECDMLVGWSQGDRGGVYYAGENIYGHPSETRDLIVARSPGYRLENVQAPILVAHGERDERVHPKQSEQLAAELRRLGKTYEYVTYPTEAHGFLRAGPQVDFYRRLERFLDWYLL
jgi:dipeptidyl aminopeptidase/acylaminoacyl peptidase